MESNVDWEIYQLQPAQMNPLRLVNKVIINKLEYEMDDNYAGLTHAILLLTDSINLDKEQK